jgi:DNA-damage-inducible protein D
MNLIQFQENTVRRVEHEGEWYFSIVDIIGILLPESPNHKTYWYVLKKREPQLLTVCKKLKLKGEDGKNYPSDCANTEGVFRIIMSVPSPKAEPFKLWLAQVGKQALDEAENPEILTAKQAEIYRAKGYPDEWITSRIKSIEIRQELTDEWKKRGVTEGSEYATLTAEIAKATFGLTPSEHSNLKGLERQNLRDHMTNLELIFTMLGEESTRSVAVSEDAQGFNENHDAARKGGDIAGNARRYYEKKTGNKVVTTTNFLPKNGDGLLGENPENTEGS